MNTRTYWQGSRFVVEWTLTDPEGASVTGATVAGTVSRPDGTTAAMTVTDDSNVYTAWYDVAEPGTHGYRLVASGTGVDAHEGVFVAHRSLVGAAPITVDPTSDIGRVRILATDLNEIEPLFTDAQVTAFLALEAGVKRAAALALETIAVSEVLISKKIRTGDGLSTDGPAVAKELRERAKALRDQADVEDGDPDDYGIEIVNYDPYAAYRVWGY
ncbi:hypothetical protein O7626_40035 [Micromonospora sp. WMMD1102]|uniref:hypothetical protein n=1 Tax=Micromonospora sp. WMMD1102 TaxID=3016105 RepID=UPI0024158B82|nr:hypothetical protein [Micromonospora sp. WMMD1102]MDG4792007.1 hypothetical protein [Micromonospora sp. WMMD1102]